MAGGGRTMRDRLPGSGGYWTKLIAVVWIGGRDMGCPPEKEQL